MRVLPALLGLVLVTGCSGSDADTAEPTPAPSPSIAGVQVFPGLSHDHLKKGQYPHAYDQAPPVGGPHSPVWVTCGVYDAPVPQDSAVHSEEHGAVWVTYRPGLKDTELATVRGLAGVNREFVLVSPYPDQNEPVIASAWGLQLRLTDVDDPRLLEFVRTYAGGSQGGEEGVTCANGATPEQAQELNDQLR